jgi:uncharacterized membrane protein (DUF485 family)
MSNSAPLSGSDAPVIDYEAVERSTKFQHLKRRHRSFVFPVAAGFLLWYFAYVLLADYAHEFMSTPVWGNINIGLILGLCQFVTTFAVTTWYVWYANRKLDPVAEELRDELAAQELAAANGAVR